MLVVHHLNNSRSQRILWLMEELGLDYEVRRYEREPSMVAPAALRRIHPLGKSPIVEDDDATLGRLVLVETGAICEYLVDKAGGAMRPPQADRLALLRYRQFLHYAEGSVMPVLFALLVVSKVPLIGKYAAGRVRSTLKVHLDYIEAELSTRPWFAGDAISAADVMMSFPLEAIMSRKVMAGDFPAIGDWLERIHSRPAYRKALDKGGAYAYAACPPHGSSMTGGG